MGEVQDCCQLSNSACLHLCPHACEYLSWRRIQAGVPESDSEASSKLLKIMIWCYMVHSEVGHCRWNCQCSQMHRYTAEVRAQSALEFCPIHCPNGRLGQDLGFGGIAFALKLPELLNRNLAA